MTAGWIRAFRAGLLLLRRHQARLTPATWGRALLGRMGRLPASGLKVRPKMSGITNPLLQLKPLTILQLFALPLLSNSSGKGNM